MGCYGECCLSIRSLAQGREDVKRASRFVTVYHATQQTGSQRMAFSVLPWLGALSTKEGPQGANSFDAVLKGYAQADQSAPRDNQARP
jgi:hypothetical protein